MTSSKTSTFDVAFNRRARLFKALAHPARLAILQYLAEIQTCITGDIADEIPLGRTTVNQHLKELKNAGLIKGTVDGVRTNYCLNSATIQVLKLEINDFLSKLEITESTC